jgi:hypothetical protein
VDYGQEEGVADREGVEDDREAGRGLEEQVRTP